MKYFLASVALLAVMIGLLAWPRGKTPSLVVHCAASQQPTLEAIVREYEQAYGVGVELDYGGSQTLLANIELTGRGDLYLPADDYYIELAQSKNLLDDVVPIARMTPVIAVKKGNPKSIHSLADLWTGDVRVALARPDTAAIGKLTRDVLDSHQWNLLQKNVRVGTDTVTQAATSIAEGPIDAGIVWDVTARLYPNLEMIHTPELDARRAHVKVGVLKCSKLPAEALRFAKFLASDTGRLEFERAGFEKAD